MMDMATIQILVMLGGFAITLAVFFFTRVKEAENRGRLMQRVDELEKIIAKIETRTFDVEKDVACHDTDLTTVSMEIEVLKKMVEKIDRKLDAYFERRDHQRDI